MVRTGSTPAWLGPPTGIGSYETGEAVATETVAAAQRLAWGRFGP